VSPAALLLAGLAAAPRPGVLDAALLQFLGDAPGALRAAEHLLAETPDDAGARLLGCTAAIEAGELDRGSELLAPLERRVPPPPRAGVLRQLLARRRRDPSEPMGHALALAWSAAGRPDLSADASLPDVTATAIVPVLSGLPSPLTPGERFLFTSAPVPPALALEASRDAADNPFVVNLALLSGLAMRRCPADPAERRRMVGPVAEAAARAAPGNGYVVLLGWLAGCPARLDARAVSRLESLAALPRFEVPRARAFREIQALAERSFASPRIRAISTWLGLDAPLVRLPPLAEGLRDPALRRRAGAAIERIGRRTAEGTAWLDRLVGLTVSEEGARLVGDPGRLAAAEARARAGRARYHAARALEQRVGSWPFAAGWREWTPDEVGDARALAALLGDRR
jgi:hypothetical protein